MKARHLYAYRYLRHRNKTPATDNSLYLISARGTMLLAVEPARAGSSLPNTRENPAGMHRETPTEFHRNPGRDRRNEHERGFTPEG